MTAWHRGGSGWHRCTVMAKITLKYRQILWTCFIVSMLFLNILFIIDLTIRHTSPDNIKKWLSGPHEGPTKFLKIEVLSSREAASVSVDGSIIFSENRKRGLHVLVLNQMNGQLMASRRFDCYIPGGDNTLPSFIQSLANGRIVIFTILDEATFSLTDTSREAISDLDSQLIKTLKWRDAWAYVTIKGKGNIAEDVGRSVSVSTWGNPVHVYVTIPVIVEGENVECEWLQSTANDRRKKFCSKYEGYDELCNCANPFPLTSISPVLPNNRVSDVPVTIIASNRPMYLYRSLKTLLSTPGANASQTLVFIDGFYQEPVDVAAMFGVRAFKHEPASQKNGRISQHYRASLTKTFDTFPNAKYAIVLEEDLDVSPDFYSYFSQTRHLMDEDSSLYCVSAWNDQGYKHSCEDPSLLYRVETMPGLGWLLSRNLFKKELEPLWPPPEKLWDWDMWMRTEFIRKGRECIIPDVSRTYHFGESGQNINPYFQNVYFKKHTISKVHDVALKNTDRMTKDAYEEYLLDLMRSAILLDHSLDPCMKDFGFIPDTKDKTYIMYISMVKRNDYETWMQLAKCFHLWDLDARGYHHGLWRFWLKGNHVLVVGVPYSPYKDHKPDGLEPIKLERKKKRKG